MTTVVHGPAATWATAHRTLLFLLAVTVTVIAAIAVVLLVQSADAPATPAVTPVEDVDLTCDYLPMTGTFC